MPKNLLDILECQKSLESSQGKYVSFFDPTANCFWCSESGQEMVCNRQWVQSWELFNIVKDEYSGATMIQSDQTKKYATLQPNNSLKCVENRSVLETHFKINENEGYFQASNQNFVGVDKSQKRLTATSQIPVAYQIFDIKTVALSTPDASSYAYPTTKSNRKVLSMGSKSPYTFYLLLNRMTGETYLETGSYEFILPDNSTLPVSYEETPIDVHNYRLKVECIDEPAGIFTLLSEVTDRYFSRVSSAEYGDVIYANADNADGLLQKFKIIPTR